MGIKTLNKNIQTLTDFVHYGQTSSYSTYNSILLRRVNKLIMLDKLAYDKYHKLLMNASMVVELDQDEYNTYRYRPDRLAFDLYGHSNLSHLILYLNNMSEYDFYVRKIRILDPENIVDIFRKIMLRESENISSSRTKIIE